jgi:macrolide transport system ATP-binding/permease protein
MNLIHKIAKKLSFLFGRKRFNGELDEEMAFHREQSEREFVATGMAPESAKYAAMRQFGNTTRLKERSHEAVGFSFETVVQDLSFALRQLRRNPGFAATAILILALGIGATVAIFAFVDAALIKPLPYAAPNRLMSVDESSANFPRSNLSLADYQDWKRMNRSFSSMDVYTSMGYLLGTSSGAEPVPAARVSDGFFSTLGVNPMLGRVFVSGEDRPGSAKIVMLSYGTWLKRFGSRTDIVGQTVTLSGDAYTIVGVLPREFSFAPRGNAEFWTPLLDDKSGCELRRSCHDLDGIGRLRDGVSEQAALGDMKAIAAQLEKQYPDSNHGQSADVVPLAEIIVGNVRPILLTLLAGAGLLLLIACVNVASLLLVRSESRRREVAVRGALGATPARLARQFVTEGLLLAVAGCLGGVVVAGWLMILMKGLIPKAIADGIPFLGLVGLDVHTGIFAAGIALLAALLISATPVLRLSFLDIRDGLGDGGRGSAGKFWKRMGANLVVVELTIAVVLLVGAGLLAQSFYRLLHVETGIDTTHLATVQVMATSKSYTNDAKKVALYREIERRLSSLPGVQSVGLTSDLPVNCNCDTDWIRIVGKPFHGEHNEVDERDISAQYLPTLKASLLRGRLINEDDDATKPQVVVINQALARKYFPGEDPIGQKIGGGDLAPKSIREIVGIVADVREGALDDTVWPAEYETINRGLDTFFFVVARTAQDEKTLLPVMVSTLRQIDPNLGVYGEQTMQQQIDASQSALLHRFSTWLVGGFAAMALVLGVVGLYGVVAYSVSQRTREIGVRMALGAQRGAVYKMVMQQAGRLTAAGIGIGLACSVGASWLMRKLLFGVQAWDAETLIGVAMVLGVAAMLASYFPARRAASVNPTEALRAE